MLLLPIDVLRLGLLAAVIVVGAAGITSAGTAVPQLAPSAPAVGIVVVAPGVTSSEAEPRRAVLTGPPSAAEPAFLPRATAARPDAQRAQSRNPDAERAAAVEAAAPQPAASDWVLSRGRWLRLYHTTALEMATQRAAQVRERLAGLGHRVDAIDIGALVVRRDRVRFFHAEDAAAASRIAASVDRDALVQDFTHLGQRPAAGTLEIWLSTGSR